MPRRGRATDMGRPKGRRVRQCLQFASRDDEPDGESRACSGRSGAARHGAGPNAEGSVEDPLHDWPEDD